MHTIELVPLDTFWSFISFFFKSFGRSYFCIVCFKHKRQWHMLLEIGLYKEWMLECL
jgi:hypothetical protein